MLKAPALPFTSVLVLAAREGEAATDRSELRRNGIRHVRIMQSGIEAARLLDSQIAQQLDHHLDRHHSRQTANAYVLPPFDLVICDEQLTDIRGVEFLQLLRNHPVLSALPVVLVSRSATRSVVLEAITAGCSGYVVRPYSPDTFATQLSRAASVHGIMHGDAVKTQSVNARGNLGSALQKKAESSVERPEVLPHALAHVLPQVLAEGKQQLVRQQFEQAISAFTEVVEEAEPDSEMLYAQGNTCLQNKDWNGAIVAFTKAVQLNVLYAEAYLGLATAWRAKGDMKKYQRYLKLAAEAYTRLEQFGEARTVFTQLMNVRPDAKNPLFGVASSLVKLGKFDAAAKAYLEASRLSPEESLHAHISRACHFTSRPEKAAIAVCRAMETVGDKKVGQQLYRRIVGMPERQNVTVPERNTSWISRFPRLQDAVSVAKYTLDMYKEIEA